jgi:hypothetical protein
MQRAMGQDGTGIAIARIERALARIEAAASRPAPPPPPHQPAPDDGAAEELRRAHQALRSRVQSAITEIDGLLAEGEQG